MFARGYSRLPLTPLPITLPPSTALTLCVKNPSGIMSRRGEVPLELLAPHAQHTGENIFIELMTSDRKLKASREGSA